ncbi:hypothetical protein FACS18949_06600 [Clostridia bacterium]|nr:hypothetical protein FACS189425_09170 [Clostridia bacterium]GHV33230.1 hypothetical protein FACS18949_06600 [Clostridia bacterium]
MKIKERDYHSTADIEAVFSRMLNDFKTRLNALPSALTPPLAKRTDRTEIKKMLQDYVNKTLNELSKYGDTLWEEYKGDSNEEIND